MAKTILHLDMNSYFATAEQQFNPALRGRPIAVTKALGRSCVIAASVEAKKLGIKTGTNVWEAKKLCPQIILVPSNLNRYLEITKKIIKIAENFSPVVDVFSIDEMFLDITDTQTLWPGGALQIAMEIKQNIKNKVGDYLTCSIGIAWSKLSAKTASEMHKPDGLTFLTPNDYLLATNHLPVSEICGIGGSRAKYLQSRGAFNLKQARALPDLPPEISDLIFLRNDESLTPKDEILAPKSVSRTYTTYQLTSDKQQVTSLVRNLIEEACGKLREMNMGGRTFGLRLDTFKTRQTISYPTSDPEIIYNSFIRQSLPENIRFAGVWVSNLMFNVQCPMFNGREKLLSATDKINSKYGLFTVYPANLLGRELIRPEVTGFLGDKYYQLRNSNDIDNLNP